VGRQSRQTRPAARLGTITTVSGTSHTTAPAAATAVSASRLRPGRSSASSTAVRIGRTWSVTSTGNRFIEPSPYSRLSASSATSSTSPAGPPIRPAISRSAASTPPSPAQPSPATVAVGKCRRAAARKEPSGSPSGCRTASNRAAVAAGAVTSGRQPTSHSRLRVRWAVNRFNRDRRTGPPRLAWVVAYVTRPSPAWLGRRSRRYRIASGECVTAPARGFAAMAANCAQAAVTNTREATSRGSRTWSPPRSTITASGSCATITFTPGSTPAVCS
jgi:hypothetical protein